MALPITQPRFQSIVSQGLLTIVILLGIAGFKSAALGQG